MRLSLVLVLLLPSLASAQTEEAIRALERKLEIARTAKWVLEQEAPKGGFYLAPQPPNVDAAPQPMLRATSGAVRALKYLGQPLLPKEREKHAKFVLSCYDPKTGAFAEPGGKPDVAITSIGVMAAVELGIPKEKFAKAMDYLKEHAKTFEEVRIAAAAVEAWGVKDCPFKVQDFVTLANNELLQLIKAAKDDRARTVGSYSALVLRLGFSLKDYGFEPDAATKILQTGQRDDGGWGKPSEKASDIETTYRVMRAMMLMKEKPKDAKKLRAFVAKHRNEDHGYAVKPGDKSSMSGAYYCAIVLHWLDEMEK